MCPHVNTTILNSFFSSLKADTLLVWSEATFRNCSKRNAAPFPSHLCNIPPNPEASLLHVIRNQIPILNKEIVEMLGINNIHNIFEVFPLLSTNVCISSVCNYIDIRMRPKFGVSSK